MSGDIYDSYDCPPSGTAANSTIGIQFSGGSGGKIIGNTIINGEVRPMLKLWKALIVETDDEGKLVKVVLEKQLLAFSRDDALVKVTRDAPVGVLSGAGFRCRVEEVCV